MYCMMELSNLYGWKTLGGRPVRLLGNGHNGVAAPSLSGAESFLELDVQDTVVDGIFQYIATTQGEAYLSTFHMRASQYKLVFSMRPFQSRDSEKLLVEWNGEALLDGTAFMGPKVEGRWKQYTVVVTGTGAIDRLTFKAVSWRGDSFSGPLLDDISVTEMLHSS